MEKTLRDRRKKLDRQQYQIASMVGVTQGMVSKVEDGIRTPKRKLGKWAAAYRCSVHQFLTMCETLQWELPLWKFSEAKTPADIEQIDCRSRGIKSA